MFQIGNSFYIRRVIELKRKEINKNWCSNARQPYNTLIVMLRVVASRSIMESEYETVVMARRLQWYSINYTRSDYKSV